MCSTGAPEIWAIIFILKKQRVDKYEFETLISLRLPIIRWQEYFVYLVIVLLAYLERSVLGLCQ